MTFDTNHRVEVSHSIYSSSIADVEIGEQIRGTGCNSAFPGSGILALFGGRRQFLENMGIADGGVVGKAKAVAAFNALNGGKGLTTDIIVEPTWEVTQQTTIIVQDTCATVVGYRGVIRGFRSAGRKFETVEGAANQPSINYPDQRLVARSDPANTCTPEKLAYAEKMGVSCAALGERFVVNSPR
jgi:hypothetical protein